MQLSVAQASVQEVGAVALLWQVAEAFDPAAARSDEAARALAGYAGDSTLFEMAAYSTFRIDYWCHAKAKHRFGDAFMPYFMRYIASVFECEGQIPEAGELLNSRMRHYAAALQEGGPLGAFEIVENLVAHTKGGASPCEVAADAPLVIGDAFDRVHLRELLMRYETAGVPLLVKKCELLAEEL